MTNGGGTGTFAFDGTWGTEEGTLGTEGTDGTEGTLLC